MKKFILEFIEEKLSKTNRFMLGICGAPGAGKSTLAEWIVHEWNESNPGQAVLVPMDGYHYSNEKLEAISLLPLKGIPDTFDSRAFVDKLKTIKTEPELGHFCPKFERSIETSIPDAISIDPRHRLIVSEGNYLLLDASPWNEIKNILDEIWFIDANEDLLLPRLIARHVAGGKTAKDAEDKVNSTDLPNARLVHASKNRADRIFDANDLSL
jgi:pantothenate kinase